MEDSRPGCIILDWDLPGRPTRGRISVLRAMVPDLKIIVINTRPELRDEILTEEIDALISKTEPPQRLIEELQRLCMENSLKKG